MFTDMFIGYLIGVAISWTIIITYNHFFRKKQNQNSIGGERMTMTAIKKLCEDGLFTHKDLINEIKRRIASDGLLADIWERGMELASNDEEQKAVMYMIFNANEECKEIFATYLYYQMRD